MDPTHPATDLPHHAQQAHGNDSQLAWNERVGKVAFPQVGVVSSVRHARPTSQGVVFLASGSTHSSLRVIGGRSAIRTHGLLRSNPASYVDIASGDRPKGQFWTDAAVAHWKASGTVPSPVMLWTPAQTGRFLDIAHAEDPWLYPLFLLVLLGGCRRGEATGIRAGQIDAATGTVTVTHQLACIGYQPVYKKVKTRNGDRVIVLDMGTLDDLTAYQKLREQQKQQGLVQLGQTRSGQMRPVPAIRRALAKQQTKGLGAISRFRNLYAFSRYGQKKAECWNHYGKP
jgi:integrase